MAAYAAACTFLASSLAGAVHPKHPFTVRDEIAIAYFGDPNGGAAQAITISPDGRRAAVHTTRGVLAKNRMADVVRIYDLPLLKAWLKGATSVGAPDPVRMFDLSTFDEGPIITDLRWLDDSRGIAFLAKTTSGQEQLWTANVITGAMRALTPTDQDVRAFDIRDANHFIYAVPAPSPGSIKLAAKLADKTPIWVADTNLETLLDANIGKPVSGTRETLWAASGGAPRQLLNPISKTPIIVYRTIISGLHLSPDGRTAIVGLPLPVVPDGWDRRYAHGFFSNATRVGPQDLSADSGESYVTSFVRVDLVTGAHENLVPGPTADSEGWIAQPPLSWSADGSQILVPGMFLSERSTVPCFAVVSANDGSAQCVMAVPANEYTDFVNHMGFDDGRNDRVWIEHCLPVNSGCANNSYTIVHFQQKAGEWRKVGETPASLDEATSAKLGISLAVKQGLNDPPVLWASLAGGRAKRPVWDPNPQLGLLAMNRAKIVHWTDASGESWRGGLYLPPDYRPDIHYPFVIQTHGFAPDQFRPSGESPEGYAARELAAAGIVVLQVPDCPNVYSSDPDEAICHETMYKGAIEQLTIDGIIDPERVGIIGFSRTCLYVLDLLTTRIFPVRAALATDGVNDGYFQFVLTAEWPRFSEDAERFVGAKPWGSGLAQWNAKSPEFNLDKVDTPLMLVAARPGFSLLTMWEPYGLLTAMHKPVDLLMLNTDAHPTWQPAARYASQQGAVDWFRFWLQGYEDSDPAKAEQYARWEKLCDLQRQQNPQDPNFCVPSHTIAKSQ